MLAPDAKHMHLDATDGKTYRMAGLVRPLERQLYYIYHSSYFAVTSSLSPFKL